MNDPHGIAIYDNRLLLIILNYFPIGTFGYSIIGHYW